MKDLAKLALAVHYEYLELGNERFFAEGAVFVRNTELSEIMDANFVSRFAADMDFHHLVARMDEEYPASLFRKLDIDHTTPPAIEAAVMARDYQSSAWLFLCLEGELLGNTVLPLDIRLDIRPVRSKADWEAYDNLAATDFEEWGVRTDRRAERRIGLLLARMRRAKSPPIRFWLSYLDGQPVGYCSSWLNSSGSGYVEDLFVLPRHRHRGIGSGLFRHCVQDCLSSGAPMVFVGADANDTPKLMYIAMGFRPVAVKREYWCGAPRQG